MIEKLPDISLTPEVKVKMRRSLVDTLFELQRSDVNRWRVLREVPSDQARRANNDRRIASYVSHIHNVPYINDVPLSSNVILGFIVASLVYGGLHALAWNAHFASSTEQILWRVSSCIVASGPVALEAGVFACGGLEYLLVRFSYLKYPANFIRYAIALVLLLMCPAYVLARAYLVVECFISLANSPEGVYKVPEWSAYLPHVT